MYNLLRHNILLITTYCSYESERLMSAALTSSKNVRFRVWSSKLIFFNKYNGKMVIYEISCFSVFLTKVSLH